MRAEIRLLRHGVVCLISLIASPDLLLLAADPCIVSDVNFAPVTNGGAIDNNPNAFGGSRIFAEKTTSAGALLNQVSLVANIGAAVAGSPVFFRSFDMDDPSSDSAPVDPNMKVGDDNRVAPKNGSNLTKTKHEVFHETKPIAIGLCGYGCIEPATSKCGHDDSQLP